MLGRFLATSYLLGIDNFYDSTLFTKRIEEENKELIEEWFNAVNLPRKKKKKERKRIQKEYNLNMSLLNFNPMNNF